MSKVSMSAAAMVQVAQAWVDAKRERPLLEKSLAKGLLPNVQASLDELIAKQSTPAASSAAAESQSLRKLLSDKDRLHDRKARGLNFVLTALSELADSEEAARPYLDVRDRLFPKGLKMIGISYQEEAGETKLVPGRLDDAARKLLEGIALPGGKTAKHALDAWLALGQEVGNLDLKRAEMERLSSGVVSPAEAKEARLQARAVESLVDMDSTLSAAEKERVFAQLRVAEARSDRKPSAAANEKDAAATAAAPPAITSVPE